MRAPPRQLAVRGAALGLLCGFLLFGGSAWALNMTVGDVVVQRLGTYGFTSNRSVLSLDAGATDQLFQMFGYLGNANGVVRVDGGSFNTAPGGGIRQVGTNVAQSNVVLDNNGAASLGLSAGDVGIGYTFTLVDDTSPANRDWFDWDISITNNSASTLSLVFYSYLDLDLGGAADFADDVATGNLNTITVTDANDPLTPYIWRASGGAASHFGIGAYPSLRNFLDGLASAQNLSDPTGAFGPADFTGAFQYDVTLAPGATVLLGSTVPEPGLLAFLVLAASLLGVRQRVLTSPA